MDSIDFDNVKAEKAKALRRFNRFRRIGSFFRAAEVCLALLFLCWTFTYLPFAFQILGVFLRRLAGVISTPLFVFLLGNSIVVVLLTKSPDQTTGVAAAAAENEIYQAFVRSAENQSKPSDQEGVTEEEIVFEDKQVIVTDLNSNSNSNLITEENIPQGGDEENERVEIDSDSSSVPAQTAQVYRRSKSDISAKQSPDMVNKRRCLKRSETTEKGREEDDENYPEDNLSNEEFQKTIEAFIAKQLMFRRQESLAVVVHNKA